MPASALDAPVIFADLRAVLAEQRDQIAERLDAEKHLMPRPNVESQLVPSKSHPAAPAAKRAFARALQAGRDRHRWLKAHAGQEA